MESEHPLNADHRIYKMLLGEIQFAMFIKDRKESQIYSSENSTLSTLKSIPTVPSV